MFVLAKNKRTGLNSFSAEIQGWASPCLFGNNRTCLIFSWHLCTFQPFLSNIPTVSAVLGEIGTKFELGLWVARFRRDAKATGGDRNHTTECESETRCESVQCRKAAEKVCAVQWNSENRSAFHFTFQAPIFLWFCSRSKGEVRALK